MSSYNLTVIGGGVMGRGIAQLALQSGISVTLWNRQPQGSEASQLFLTKALEKSVAKEKLTKEQAQQALDHLVCTSDFEKSVSQANFIIENIPEDLDLKKEMFKRLGKLASSEAILSTNTSSLSVTQIAQVSGVPERVIGMHFFNPPLALRLLEIVVPETTSELTYEKSRALGEILDRKSIRVKDSPGFATSRLSVCIGLEAVRMLEEGVASAQDIDTAMEVGYRHPMGPLKLGDYVGLDVRCAVAQHLYQKLKSETFKPPQLLEQMVADKKLGKKVGQGFYDWAQSLQASSTTS